MNRTTAMLFATTALLASAAADASHAGNAPPAAAAAGGAHADRAPPVCSALPVLYEQDPATTGRADSGIAVVSQKFESSLSQYDAQAADDFKVPVGSTWTINEVDVVGQYFNGPGPANYEIVKFFNTNAGLPSTLIATRTAVGADNQGSFCITLPTPVVLPPGHYWVSVKARMNFNPRGEWGWENLVPPQIFRPAAWRNSGGGFGVCPNWAAENVCVANGQGDHIFTLR